MRSPDDRPQIGAFTTEPGSMESDGVALEALAADLGVMMAPELPEGTPDDGWRVIATNRGLAQAIAAPVDTTKAWWRIGQIVRGGGAPKVPRVSVHPVSFPRRPSRRDRAGGLALRWPEVTRSTRDVGMLAIDIVNTGTTRWLPNGDSFMVYAALTAPAGPSPSVSFGYVEGQSPPMPLDPGEYARVRVLIDSGQWQDLHPGPHEAHAILVDLGLHGENPLEIDLTEDDIERHRPKRRPE